MQFLKNSQNKISPIQFKIDPIFQDNPYKLLKDLRTKSQIKPILIKLLGISIITGIVGCIFVWAFVLPSQFRCGNRETDGKNAVGTINRAQQAYHFEKNTFSYHTNDLSTNNELGVIIPESKYYNFSKIVTNKVAYSFAIPKDTEKDKVRIYTGAVFFREMEGEYLQIICQGNVAGIEVNPSKPILKNGELSCPKNMTIVK